MVGCLAGFAMLALVGDLLKPPARLRVHIVQAGEGSQWPKVLAHISDGALHFTFFPGRRDMTSAGNEAILASECEETRIEPHQIALVFSDSGSEIVEPKFAGTTAQLLESMNVATHECLETLAVSKLQIHLAAMALD